MKNSTTKFVAAWISLATLFSPKLNAQETTPLEVIGNVFSQPNLINSNGNWNNLATRGEKESYALNVRASMGSYVVVTGPNVDCSAEVNQMTIEGFGLLNAEEFVAKMKEEGINHSIENNGKYNIPLYYFSTTNKNGVPHAISGILVGENPLEFNDWLFLNYHDTSPVHPGDWDMGENSPVTMSLTAYLGDGDFNVPSILKFNLSNGIGSVKNYWKEILFTENPNNIAVKVGNLENLVIHENPIPRTATLTPEFLKAYGYNAIPNVETEGTAKNPMITYFDKNFVNLPDGYSFERFFVSKIQHLAPYRFFSSEDARQNGIYEADTSDVPQNIRFVNAPTSAVDEPGVAPDGFAVSQNYPNPFNSSTSVKYSVRNPSDVSFKVYGVNGRLVDEINYRNVTPGSYEYNVDLSGYPSGVYFLNVRSGNNNKIIKMNYLR